MCDNMIPFFLKVIQTLNARAAGQTDLPSASSIISDKNYIMVWDIVT